MIDELLQRMGICHHPGSGFNTNPKRERGTIPRGNSRCLAYASGWCFETTSADLHDKRATQPRASYEREPGIALVRTSHGPATLTVGLLGRQFSAGSSLRIRCRHDNLPCAGIGPGPAFLEAGDKSTVVPPLRRRDVRQRSSPVFIQPECHRAVGGATALQ